MLVQDGRCRARAASTGPGRPAISAFVSRCSAVKTPVTVTRSKSSSKPRDHPVTFTAKVLLDLSQIRT